MGSTRKSTVTRESKEATAFLFELLQAHKRVFHDAARDHGLSPPQAATLMMLEPGHGLSMSALAELLMCDASNVTGIVDKLESRGFARRVQGEDRRVKELTLTADGEALRGEIRERMLTPPSWIVGLAREEQRSLRDILQRCAQLLRGTGEE